MILLPVQYKSASPFNLYPIIERSPCSDQFNWVFCFPRVIPKDTDDAIACKHGKLSEDIHNEGAVDKDDVLEPVRIIPSSSS
jgi:hypothetical protein